MPEDHFLNEQPLDFDDYANQLLDQGLETSPAVLHGGICGVLVGSVLREPDYVLALVGQALEIDIHGELAESSLRLISTSLAALADEEFEFHLFLPDDEVAIASRVIALADWCRGFLATYALLVAEPEAATLGEEVSEILKDMYAITEVGFADDGDEEEAESNYFELTDYLRFATLNLFMENEIRLDSDG